MDIHPCHFWFSISLNHTEKLPAISFIIAGMICYQVDWRNPFSTEKLPAISFIIAGMICYQVDWRNPFSFEIIYRHIKQMPRNTFATIVFFRIYSTDIWA